MKIPEGIAQQYADIFLLNLRADQIDVTARQADAALAAYEQFKASQISNNSLLDLILREELAGLLARHGIHRIHDLEAMTPNDLKAQVALQMPTIDNIQATLQEHGFTLKLGSWLYGEK